jgi:hypothetical protein
MPSDIMAAPLRSCVLALLILQPASPRVYTDPSGRFTFSYPASFGTTMPGTNDGFEDRVAAVRFSSFPAIYGGEAVLTQGLPLIDLQAAGGLYDSLTLEIFPAPIRRLVVAQLPRLTPANLCEALAATTHLDPAASAFASLTPQQRSAIDGTDRMRNANPKVTQCRSIGAVVMFDKERAFGPGSPAQHVYGAVRFLSGRFSTFQLIAGGVEPSQPVLDAIVALVASFN